jgi:hypothetical protein
MTTPTLVNHAVNAGCLAAFWALSGFLSSVPVLTKVSSAFGVFGRLWTTLPAWLTLCAVIASTTFPWLMTRYVRAMAMNECLFLQDGSDEAARYAAVGADADSDDDDAAVGGRLPV